MGWRTATLVTGSKVSRAAEASRRPVPRPRALKVCEAVTGALWWHVRRKQGWCQGSADSHHLGSGELEVKLGAERLDDGRVQPPPGGETSKAPVADARGARGVDHPEAPLTRELTTRSGRRAGARPRRERPNRPRVAKRNRQRRFRSPSWRAPSACRPRRFPWRASAATRGSSWPDAPSGACGLVHLAGFP